MSRLIGELTGQPFVLLVMLTGLIWLHWKKSCSVFSVVISEKQVAVYCRILIWNPRWNATRTIVYNSLRACNVFLLLTIRAISSKQRLFWNYITPVLRVIYLINLTSQNRYVTRLKWIWRPETLQKLFRTV